MQTREPPVGGQPHDGTGRGSSDTPEPPASVYLSHIETAWSMVREAHQASDDVAGEARRRLLERYGAPAMRYLRGAVRDAEAADDLFQDFALRFLRGDFKRADPQRGRFRKFLKTALVNLVIDHQRRRRKVLEPLPGGDIADGDDSTASEADFSVAWRSELLSRAGSALAAADQRARTHRFTVLRFRADNPKMRSEEMAAALTRTLGKAVTAGWVRKQLHHAREQFAELLLDEIGLSIEARSLDEVEEEAIDLGLFEYCRVAARRRRAVGHAAETYDHVGDRPRP